MKTTKTTKYVNNTNMTTKEEPIFFRHLKPGVCFSWGIKSCWYIKLDDNKALSLVSGSVSDLSSNNEELTIASEVSYQITEVSYQIPE